jgi:tetratricopeptide (TPR) repeat protein
MKKTSGLVIYSLFIITLVCASISLEAKVWAKITGTVKSVDGKPIKDARIILIFSEDQSKFELKTDNKGRWSKVDIRPGQWTIGFMADGYEPQNINITLSAIKRNPPVDIKLNPIPKSPLTDADALYKEGKYKEALTEYQRVQSKNHALHQVNEKIGLCFYRLKDYDNAIKAFKFMLEKEPNAKISLINLCAINFEQGKLEEGMKYLSQLGEENIKDHTIFYNIGIILFNNNKMDMAIDYLKKSINLNPKYLKGYYQLAMAYMNKGEIESAKKNLQKIMELDPESEQAAQAKEILKALN